MRSRGVTSAEVDVPALYEAHWLGLVRLAVLLVGDRGVAEDVTQEAFLGLHRNAARVRDPNAALAYVRSSVVNLSRSSLRRRVVARRRIAPMDVDVAGADESVVLHEEHAEVLTVLRTLPDRQREVLVLRYWSDLSEVEIADTLDISVGTVKSSASRGLAALRKALETS